MSSRKIIGALVSVIALAGFSWLHGQQTKVKLTADDFVAIEQLYANYVYALDQGQGERFAATWVDDGEFTGARGAGRGGEVRTPIKGKEALVSLGSRGSGRRHFVSNLMITRTPEGANASCYLLQFDARNIPATLTQTAIYEDTLVKTSQGWRFKKRVVWNDTDDVTPFKGKPLPPQEQGSPASQ